MKFLPLIIGAAVLAVLIARRRRGITGRSDITGVRRSRGGLPFAGSVRALGSLASVRAFGSLGSVGLVAAREVRERVRGRLFRFGTLIMLLAVAAGIIIPRIHANNSTHPHYRVGVVGTLSAAGHGVVLAEARRVGASVELVPEASVTTAHAELRSRRLDLAIVGGRRLVVDKPISATDTSTQATFVRALAEGLGVLATYEAAGLSPDQVARVSGARPLPIMSLRRATTSAVATTSVIGVILVFIMLTQYNTWILIGVMQEKSSRVVEVLLATMRPLQLLAGKVLGIGIAAMGQAALILVVALGLAAAVGSNLLHGTAPLEMGSDLLWLVLGYAFYCWVYAAAGSMAERQDQVQTLALPLTVPILVGYIFGLTTASTGHPSVFFNVLAYLPPTAPLTMPILVGLGRATWWEFTISALISLAATAVMAQVAAGIYRRAILRTGRRVYLRDLIGRTAR